MGFDEFEVSIRRYTGSSPIVQVPEGVCVIGARAFENHAEIHELVIPEGVVEILSLIHI